MTKTNANVFDVAEYILQQTGEISTWKLQKLVYYAQAWHCVWSDKPLFDEKIHAWMNGPVCSALYRRHKGKFSVTTIGGDAGNLNEDEKDSIDKVIEYYGKYNSQQLVDLTHQEDPWLDARGTLKSYDKGDDEVTLENMAKYYSSL